MLSYEETNFNFCYFYYSIFALAQEIDTSQIIIPIKIGYDSDRTAISDTTSTLVLADDQEANVAFNDAVQLYQQGQYQAAIQSYSKALQMNPNLIDAYKGRGSSYVQLSNFKSAESDFEKFFAKNQNSGEAAYLLAYSQYYLDKLEDAEKTF